MAGGPGYPHKKVLQAEDTGSINEVHGWRRLLLWLLASLVRVWGRTLRFEADAETRRMLTKADEPVAIVLWHNRLFLSPEMFRRYRYRRKLFGLVSASKDGAWLAALYRMIGMYPVRGSSSQLGREAARALIEVMQQGCDVGITPDGPRGPMYVVEPGALIVTRRTGAPMVLFGAEFTRAWRLKSWDRFYVPWPFSRVIMHSAVLPPRKADGTKLEIEDVRAALMAVNPDLPE
ncbi:MAG TPA: lysophospholipid acyltransferase family protein [Lacunisphaera sp.]|nr:lysophospholipid acyltransferase family protein [Lacunisphaera sp.]